MMRCALYYDESIHFDEVRRGSTFTTKDRLTLKPFELISHGKKFFLYDFDDMAVAIAVRDNANALYTALVRDSRLEIR